MLDLPFHNIKFDEFNLIVNEQNPTIETLQELHYLLKDVLNLFANPMSNYTNKNILKVHPGGKQAILVYECIFNNKKVAVKIYKPITTHLIVHTIASTYVMQNIDIFNDALNDRAIKLFFPKTFALGYSNSTALLTQVSILVQEWVEDSLEIHKIYPKDHVAIIKSIIKKMTTEHGLMVDIMSKNWLGTYTERLSYIDLILFNPKGKILEKIKEWAKELDYKY